LEFHFKKPKSLSMKKTLVLISTGLFLFVIGCTKSAKNEPLATSQEEETSTPITHRQCATYEVLQEQLKADPSLAKRMNDIEDVISKVIANPSQYKLVNGVYEIPVWVNVLYKTSAENISDAQIQSQINVLNEDFGATNGDIGKIPSLFSGVQAGNIPIKFVWDASKVTRKATTTTSWSTNNAMKYASQGGIDATTPTTVLNIWVCNLANGILGYAQFPGGTAASDGVVILYSAFGSRAKYPTGTFINTYDLGRTATHEVGHWLNLRHIWGDARCGTDFVDDTPAHDAANYGCPLVGHKSRCAGKPVEMTMNYMDYTDDFCMYMFTAKQEARMLATFATGGGRTGFALP
jgi:hypothetical protein